MEIVATLGRSWQGMKKRLFQPFDIRKWCVVGFSAWLAGLMDGGGGGGTSNFQLPDGQVQTSGGGSLAEIAAELENAFGEAWEWIVGGALALVVTIVAVVIAVLVILLWVSSRGKFVYLDNVVHDRSAIVEPWKRSREIGNSLFLFRLAVFGVALVGVFACIAVVIFAIAQMPQGGPFPLLPLVGCALVGLTLGIGIAYAMFFLDAFVVPIMYREGLKVLAAWRRFLPLLRENLGGLLLVGLFVAGLHLAVGVAVLVTGVLTCCIGFLLLLIPYVGTVILLPLLVTYRLYTVDLLGQLDAGLVLLSPDPPPAPPAVEAAPAA